MTDPDLIQRAERACYAVWPALRETTVDGWLLRFAGGHTNRANSVNVLRSGTGDLDADVTLIEGRPDGRWLAAAARLAGIGDRAAALRSRMIDAIAVPAAFASVEVDGIVAAQAYGAVSGGLVCLNAVATAPDHRGRGLASRAVAALLGWAAERHGAAGACLQVLADNPAALALYRRFGFATELSRYHYRTKALG